MKSSTSEEMLALYALGVPVELLSKQYGLKVKSIHKAASVAKVKRPAPSDKALLNRVARSERIRRHCEEYPSTSLFSTLEAAA